MSMSTIDNEKFNNLKTDAESFYKTLDQVNCPYFGEKVSFNAKGLEHLKFKKKKHARPRSDQYIRFKILQLAPEVIKLSRTVQGISEQTVFEPIRTNQRNESKMVRATFYEFIAVLQNTRVRVIVKQIADGPKYFWSIIPFWKLEKEDSKKRMHYGNPEHD